MDHSEFQSIPDQVPHGHGYYTTLQTHKQYQTSIYLFCTPETTACMELSAPISIHRSDLPRCVVLVRYYLSPIVVHPISMHP